MTDLQEKWQKLCEEHEETREAFYQAFSTVSQKFGAVVNSDSTENPSSDELGTYEKAMEAWHAAQSKMKDFVTKHSK